VAALRSVLDIPVFGPGKVSMLAALMLGDKFSILTMASRWKPLYKKALHLQGFFYFKSLSSVSGITSIGFSFLLKISLKS
jgi:Asp/Glu/hydantoin racemase